MNCEAFLDLLDEGKPLPPEALAHLEACPRCARAHLLASVTARGLDALREDEAPPDLHLRLMAGLQAKGPRFLHLRHSWALPVAALLVVTLLGGASLLNLLRRGRPETLPLPRPSVATPHPAIEKHERETYQAPKRAPVEEPTFPADSEKALPPPPPRPLELHREPPLTLSEDLGEVRPLAPPSPPTEEGPPGQADVQPPPSRGGLLLEGTPSSAGASEATPSLRNEAAPSSVLCAMETLDRGRYASLQLPSGFCPPSGVHWYVVLGDRGVTEVTDGKGRSLPDVVQEVDGAVRFLHLPPGRYKLRRVG